MLLKKSYYLYQNQLNLQRLQETERELAMRQYQQRELVLQRDQQIFGANGIPYKPVIFNKFAAANKLKFEIKI